MSYFKETVCPRCGEYMQGRYYNPCPRCRDEGFNIGFETKYDVVNAKLPEKSSDYGIYRFSDFFAMNSNSPKISIGEGNTPLRKLNRLGRLWGLSNLYIKDESKNPTMSHKDRMCSIIVSKALEFKARGVVISSTGNQGASTAAYCKVAGIPCVIFTTPNVSPVMKTLMQSFGAYVFVTPTMEDRLIIT